jgi:hypothetical protein
VSPRSRKTPEKKSESQGVHTASEYFQCGLDPDIKGTKPKSNVTPSMMLRTGRVSVVIRRLVHHSWYEPAGERHSRAGTNWKGSAGQGPAIRARQALDRQSSLIPISVSSLVISSASNTISCPPVCCAQQMSPRFTAHRNITCDVKDGRESYLSTTHVGVAWMGVARY